MYLIDVITFSLFFGVIEGFQAKKFKLVKFIRDIILFFIIGIIFKISFQFFFNKWLAQIIPSEKYGSWVLGAFLFLYSVYVAIKGFKNKTDSNV